MTAQINDWLVITLNGIHTEVHYSNDEDGRVFTLTFDNGSEKRVQKVRTYSAELEKRYRSALNSMKNPFSRWKDENGYNVHFEYAIPLEKSE